MKLTWAKGQGPATTQELADVVEAEGRLERGAVVTPDGLRCLWGVIEDYSVGFDIGSRQLSRDHAIYLIRVGCGIRDNDNFSGTPEERCAEMVQRLRAIP